MRAWTKRALSQKRELIEVREMVREASAEVEYCQAAVWPKDKAHIKERNKLTAECRKLSKIIEEARWDVAARVL